MVILYHMTILIRPSNSRAGEGLVLVFFFEWSKVNSVLLLSCSSVEIVPRDESFFSEINRYILF